MTRWTKQARAITTAPRSKPAILERGAVFPSCGDVGFKSDLQWFSCRRMKSCCWSTEPEAVSPPLLKDLLPCLSKVGWRSTRTTWTGERVVAAAVENTLVQHLLQRVCLLILNVSRVHIAPNSLHCTVKTISIPHTLRETDTDLWN